MQGLKLVLRTTTNKYINKKVTKTKLILLFLEYSLKESLAFSILIMSHFF
jgi:hypothetical protein